MGEYVLHGKPEASFTPFQPLPHGGDLAAATRRFGPPPGGVWLDLSTGLNPLAYSVPDLPATAWSLLPDAAAHRRLKDAAAGYFDCDPDHITPGPGAQGLLQLLPFLRPPGRVAVLGPTYGEHEARWRAAGHEVSVVTELADDTDVMIVVSPNNPTGARHAPQALLELARRLAHRGGWLVVDQAFVDDAPADALRPAGDDTGLIVLRSFGKFFGLAGLRLGFALTAPALARRIAAALGPWAVNGPALEIGARALADHAWIAAARAALKTWAGRRDRALQDAGLRLLGGTCLFRLVETARAGALYNALGKAGVLVRRFADQPDWLRFGLPGDAPALSRLTCALQEAGRP